MEQEIRITFLEHSSFSKEIKKFNKKYNGDIGFRHLRKLLELHFHPVNKQLRFSQQVLRRVDRLGANIEAYKVIMRVKGLKSGQSPRICFRRVGNMIVFLCFGTHIDNYKDSNLKKLIKKQILDLDPEAQLG